MMKLYLVERDWDKCELDELCSFVCIAKNELELNKLVANTNADFSGYLYKEFTDYSITYLGVADKTLGVTSEIIHRHIKYS